MQQQMVTETLYLHWNVGDVSIHSSQHNRLHSVLWWSKNKDPFHIKLLILYKSQLYAQYINQR